MSRDPRVLPLRGAPLLRRLMLSEVMGKPRGLAPWRPRRAGPPPPPQGPPDAAPAAPDPAEPTEGGR